MASDKLIGKILGQRYEIIEQIGEGGMAIVYRARCKMLNRYVAIKVLKDEYKVDEEIVKKFNRESQAAASLSHPNIVSVYDVGNDDGVYYIVMELVEGITLKEYIAKHPKMDWHIALRFSMQICSALAHAHRNGIIHRDIKPHNIIISKDGNCKVADFGIASVANMNETRKVDEGILGSVHYISPEHAKGVIPDERSDIYSLGITMYEMLTGQLPFDGESAVSIAVMHINKTPTPIKDINFIVPLALVQVVDKAMCKDINLRYQSANDMYKDLYEISNDPEICPTGITPESLEEDLSRTKKIKKDEAEEIKKYAEENENKDKKIKKKKVTFKDKIKKLFSTEDKKDKVAVIAAVITSVIILLAVGTFAVDMIWPGTMSHLFSSHKKEFVIPDLEGEKLTDVKEKYKDYKIEFIIDDEIFNEDYNADEIISHEPLAGMNVKLPIKIHLVVSKGAKSVVLSRYIDKEGRQAEAEIKNLGLKCNIKEEYDEEIPEGYVISQDPLPNTKLKSGDTVTLTISKGLDNELVVVPKLIGLTEAEAKAKLSDANLSLGGIIRQNSSKDSGIVIDQSVSEGSELAKKSKITLTVSNGKSTESQTPSGNNNRPANTENNSGNNNGETNIVKTYTLSLELPTTKDTVEVVVKQNSKNVYSKTVSTSLKALNVTLKGSGLANIEVYYDGILVKTQKITF